MRTMYWVWRDMSQTGVNKHVEACCCGHRKCGASYRLEMHVPKNSEVFATDKPLLQLDRTSSCGKEQRETKYVKRSSKHEIGRPG